MASRYSQGVFTPKNPDKYCGPNLNRITYRSGWEHSVMRHFDSHPNVLRWSSECISIPYRHPLLTSTSGKFKIRMYIPDFFVIWADKNGKQSAAIWEIKPLKENPWINQGGKFDKRTQLVRAINYAKWTAAIQYCAKRRWQFQVITEVELFAFTRK
jgi:hypothetical protein